MDFGLSQADFFIFGAYRATGTPFPAGLCPCSRRPIENGRSSRPQKNHGQVISFNPDRDRVFSLKSKCNCSISGNHCFRHQEVPQLIIPLLQHEGLLEQAFGKCNDSFRCSAWTYGRGNPVSMFSWPARLRSSARSAGRCTPRLPSSAHSMSHCP